MDQSRTWYTMPTIDISGINREELLCALWERASPASYFQATGSEPPTFSFAVAKQQLRHDGYADYVCGRAIKTNIFSGDQVDPLLYDRDAGAGAFQEVVDSLR